MTNDITHQYVERASGRVVTEKFCGDAFVRLLYGPLRENAPALFRALVSARATKALAWGNMDFRRSLERALKFAETLGVDMTECLDPPETFTSARKVFERRIRYYELRPMPVNEAAVVSPADSMMLPGSLSDQSGIVVKGKFFSFDEILGPEKTHWQKAFEGGDFAVFRLTPDKYHYNHAPVSGVVADIYETEGRFHSCNPEAVVRECTPYSQNRRVVTVIKTDVPGGSGVGLVAMIEVAALMIGRISQCYSETGYESQKNVTPGLFLKKGQPKSIYHPGSSTDILLFQKDRIRFSTDILENARRTDVASRFSKGFGQTLVETEVKVREEIGIGM